MIEWIILSRHQRYRDLFKNVMKGREGRSKIETNLELLLGCP
jgi:hypothetical protein